VTEAVDVASLLVAKTCVRYAYTVNSEKPHVPPMSTRSETVEREVTRRRDGVVVVREDDPETGETIERKYPACPVEMTVKRRRARR
jgi:hypothetical protein